MSLKDYLQQQPDTALSGKLKVVAWVLTAVVLALVGLMQQIKIDLPEGVSLSFLPAVHAVLNSCVALLLILALVMIKKGNVEAHKKAISAAMVCSILFLCCYVSYHITTESTKFGGTGAIRVVYLVLLISHIVLARNTCPAGLCAQRRTGYQRTCSWTRPRGRRHRRDRRRVPQAQP